jgi:hypothetical protein
MIFLNAYGICKLCLQFSLLPWVSVYGMPSNRNAECSQTAVAENGGEATSAKFFALQKTFNANQKKNVVCQQKTLGSQKITVPGTQL